MTIEDFHNIAPDFVFDFAKDSFFTELKDGEIIENRVNLARNFQDMVGKYYSQEWLRKNILQQSEDDIEEMDKEIKEEANSGDERWLTPQQQEMEMMQQQQGAEGDTSVGGQIPQTANVDDGVDSASPTNEKNKKMQEAKARYNLLKNKKDKTLKDEAELKSVAQILAKNK